MKRVHMLAGAALLAVLGAGGVAIADTTTAAPAANTCQVTVDRSQAANSFRVDKQQLENGNCVCYVYTGPETQSAETEAKVADIQRRGDCSAEPLAAALPAAGSQLTTGVVAGGLAIVGIVAALAASGGGHHSDSTGG